jgi:transposase InsO family protein
MGSPLASSRSAPTTAPRSPPGASRPSSPALGSPHRRGGYRDPESQAFIESWFGKLKERLIWRSEFETLEQARAEIGGYVDAHHHRPHPGLDYRTPKEVRETWEDAREADEALRNQAA